MATILQYYQKLEFYPVQWKYINLSRNKAAGAHFGGPIAFIHEDSKIVQLSAELALCKLQIFNSAGVQISETVWKHPGGCLVCMAWTDDQILICVFRDGTIFRYNVLAEFQEANMSMGKECFEQKCGRVCFGAMEWSA